MRISATAASTQRPERSRLEIATYNVLYSTSDRQTKDDLTRLMKRNGVINLQEFDSSHRDLFKWVENQGWGHHRAPGGPQEPILWDKSKYKLVDAGGHKLNGEIDKIGNARGHYPARSATWVRLKDKETGKVFTTVSVHLIAHNRGPKQTPIINRVSKQQFRELAELTEKLSKHGPVIIGGDLNTNAARNTWPREILKDAHLRSNWQQLGREGVGPGGTHGRAIIDHFLTSSTMRDRLKILGHDIVRGLHSDHNAVEADYRLR